MPLYSYNFSVFNAAMCFSFSFIADTLAPLTNNLKIGLGSFTDKPQRPFVREYINGSLFVEGQATFRHIIDLTFDMQLFSVSWLFNYSAACISY